MSVTVAFEHPGLALNMVARGCSEVGDQVAVREGVLELLVGSLEGRGSVGLGRCKAHASNLEPAGSLWMGDRGT